MGIQGYNAAGFRVCQGCSHNDMGVLIGQELAKVNK
jgi:hypothetical protein